MDQPSPALPAPHLDPIGDDTWSVINWLAALPELLPWIGIGFLCGGGVVLTSIGATLASGEQIPKWVGTLLSSMGPMMIAAAAVGIYAASRFYRKQEDKKRRKIRAEYHDEIGGERDKERAELVESFKAYREAKELFQDELIANRENVDRAKKLIEAEESDRAAWTPGVVNDHSEIALSVVALFAADRLTRKPVLIFEWRFTSLAKVPCDIILMGGTCTIFTLPTPGEAICSLQIGRFDVPFDGTLRPGSISARRTERVEVPETACAKIREALSNSVAANALIEFEGAIRLNGAIHEISRLEPIQQVITAPPEWLRQKEEHR